MDSEFFSAHIRVWTQRKAACPLPEQRILVVDDFIDTATALCKVMTLHGFDVRAAYGGCEAMQIAAAWHPRTIVLDIEMPDLSGLAVAVGIRRIAALAGAVLVAHTAQFAPGEFEAMRQSGFDAACVKPATPGTLIRLLETLAVQ